MHFILCSVVRACRFLLCSYDFYELIFFGRCIFLGKIISSYHDLAFFRFAFCFSIIKHIR